MYISNIEPMHHEQGAYRNWYNHTRNQWFKSWNFWMRDKRLGSRGHMTNVTEETVILARLLWALHQEALGKEDTQEWKDGYPSWDELEPFEREAWVQVAQYVTDHYGNQEPDHK